MGWPDKPIGWADILALSRDPAGWGKLGHPEWGAFRLGKTNPNFSTSGLNATIAAYFAATGRSSDLTDADLGDPKVLDFVKGVESSVVHYGDTTLTFLANLQAADDRGVGLTYVSAVTVEEKSVWDYNKGNPSGDPKTLGQHSAPHTPLVAIYPKDGTLYSDNPYVVLSASWVDASKKRAADDFLKFLQSSRQQRRFQDAAIRALDQFSPDDALGLWIFSTDLDQGKPFLELVPISPVGQRLGDVKAKISSLVPRGGTALYATTREATRRMRASFDASRINAVVLLTDGYNEDDHDNNQTALLAHLATNPNIPVFTIAFGSGADLATLRKIAQATDGWSFDARDTSDLAEVLPRALASF